MTPLPLASMSLLAMTADFPTPELPVKKQGFSILISYSSE